MVVKKNSLSTNTPFLVRNSCERIPVKSFKEEIRAGNDVKNFIADARVALDVAETDIGKILETALVRTIGPNLDVSEFLSMVRLSDDVYQLKDTISGMSYQAGNYAHDQSWLVIMACLPSLKERVTVMVRLMFPVNFGANAHDVRFLVLVMTPMDEKITKNAFETGRSFATLFVKPEFRNDLLGASTVQEFLSIVERRRDELVHGSFDSIKSHELTFTKSGCYFAAGICENIIRRIKFYPSDFVDGLVGKNTLRKTLATILFLYFACILPCIAFGVLVDKATGGLLDARRAIIGQAIGGLFFALFSGQPLVIIATTAPLCLFTKVVFGIARDFNVDFYAMFACVGLWNSLFVILYSLLDVSVLMKWCTRNTEEIFAIFIFFAFTVDSLKDVVANFQNFYPGNGCNSSIIPLQSDTLGASSHISDTFDLMGFPCKPESCILFILLMLGTLWLALKLYNFNQTPYLSTSNRDLLSDYALPIAVIIFSFVGSFLFQAVETERFQFRDGFTFHFASLKSLTPQAIGIGAALGFTLSLLFFMDQNISAALVNTPYNNLKKGSGYHLDLFIVGVLNGFTAMLGLPWMHGILPHSPLHARSLADIEERVEDGCVKQVIVRVRETRITGIVAHIMIGLSLYLIPYPLSYIPVPVLDGLFLYCAVASLRGNSFFERFCLFFTEQRSYPPNHYIRRCPQRAIHTFTVTQIIQLAIICAFGFWNYPYVQMAFPVVIALLIPIRHFIIPCFIPKDYLEALDGYH